MMTTQEVADKLVERCREGNYQACYENLYSPDIVSIEAMGTEKEETVSGMAAVAEKGKKWNAMMEKFISGWTGDALVAGNYITLTMGFECIYVGQTESTKEEEVCVYEVKDGKIVKEMFFY